MRNLNKKARLIVQLFFLILIGVLATNHVLSESGRGWSFISNASLHSLCPFGGVVTIYNLFTVGTFIQKIHESALILMVIVFMLSLLFGAVFCGWICPLGTVQELVGKVGRRVLGKSYNNIIPSKLDNYLRFLRYGVLIWVIYVTAATTELIFNDYDPYHALYTFWSGEVAIEALVILAVSLIFSLFVERPWCKYACPYGALLGITNFIRVFKIKRRDSSCISCSSCDNKCPMNVKVSKTKAVRNHQCITCLQCTSDISCPAVSTVELTMKGM